MKHSKEITDKTNLDDKKLKEWSDAIDKHLANLSDEDIEEMKKHFEDKKPKGWLSIEEHLPMMYARDVMQGYSLFRVKDKNGNEFQSPVADGNTWYYRAKDSGIIQWFNE